MQHSGAFGLDKVGRQLLHTGRCDWARAPWGAHGHSYFRMVWSVVDQRFVYCADTDAK